jgi:hypothetical protein
MYCSIEEAWPTYNYNNNNISRDNGVENFLNDQVTSNSIMNKNDTRPQFVDNGIHNVINRKHSHQTQPKSSNYLMENYNDMNLNLDSKTNFTRNNLYNSENYTQSDLDLDSHSHSHSQSYSHSKLYNCRDFINHLESCEECQMIMYNKFKPNKFQELLIINPQIKETIVIFLIGLLVLMILNLFYK